MEDTHYEYMYTYKYPTENPPEGGEAAYAKTLKKEVYGYNWDVTVLGLSKNTKYFDVDLKDGKNRVAISSSFAEKYGYGVGDEIVLHDEENDIDYGFTVDSVTQYTPAFYVFMTIDDAHFSNKVCVVSPETRLSLAGWTYTPLYGSSACD